MVQAAVALALLGGRAEWIGFALFRGTAPVGEAEKTA